MVKAGVLEAFSIVNIPLLLVMIKVYTLLEISDKIVLYI